MTPELWPELERVFFKVIAFGSDVERRTFLDAECAGRPELRREVESLLKHSNTTDGPLKAHASLVGATMLHYQVIEEVAQGGTCKVYRAIDTRLGRTVVLKVLRPLLRTDAAIGARFLREARCASQLSHPNIVVLLDMVTEHDPPFIVMEYVAGKTLKQVIPPTGLALATALRYGIEIADALRAAHQTGIIHRDLKPPNLIIAEDGRIKVADFGLAKAFGAALEPPAADQTPPGILLGTAGFMSPEQTRGQECDPRSDLFSFGAIFYQMLTGERAFNCGSDVETMAAILNAEPAALPNHIPQDVVKIVSRCLQKDRERRYPSASDLLHDLQKVAVQTASLQRCLPLSASPRLWSRNIIRTGLLAVSVLCAMAVVVRPRWWHEPTDRPAVPAVQSRRDLMLVAQDSHSQAKVPVPSNNNIPESDDSATERYYRGEQYLSKADKICYENPRGDCDVDGAISYLKRAIAEFDTVLKSRPHHRASLWNRGISYSDLCEIQSRNHAWDQARAACDRAIRDFEGVLVSSSDDNFVGGVPQEDKVLWNRGVVHLLRARIPVIPKSERIAEFTKAISEFDRLLNGGPQYASFLKTRKAKITEYRLEAVQERAALTSTDKK